MRVTDLLLAATTLAQGSSALKARGDTLISSPTGNATVTAPKRYIIEFAAGTDAAAAKAEIAARSGTTILRTFSSDVFTGISVVSTEDNIDTLTSLGTVAQVWNSKKIALAPSTPAQVWASDAQSPNYTIHDMTGVDKLHALGIRGKGAVVGIVDTGVQYTHPALGGGIGPGFKIAGGYDYVGDGCWPYSGCDKQPDDDPTDEIGHGTHVTGIIIGETDGFVGVAPDATVYMYKVFTDYDGTDEDTLIDGFLGAYDQGVDIITCSVGGPGGWATDAWGTVASRMVDQGIVVMIANGNNGVEGPAFGSIGSAGSKVLGVASIEATTVATTPFLAHFYDADNNTSTAVVGYKYPYNPIPGIANYTGRPIWPTSLNTSVTDDACNPLPTDTPNLDQYTVLVRLGGCTPRTKQTNILAYGGHIELFYYDDTTPEGSMPLFSRIGNFAGVISTAAGEAIVNQIVDGGKVIADYTYDTNTHWASFPNHVSDAGVANYYTSWGPSYDLDIKPDIAAPGGDIFSTYPNGYAVLSGTSMATPYVAGVAALYIGQYGGRHTNPKFNATNLIARIISSGNSVPFYDPYEDIRYETTPAPPSQVGGGLIDGFKVLNYTSQLSYAKFALNDTHYFERYHSVDITNNAAVSVTYSFDVEDAAGFDLYLPADPSDPSTPRPKSLSEIGAPSKFVPGVSLPSGTFKLAPGQTKTAQISFSPLSGVGALPLYGGKIVITSSLGEVLSVPYVGLASSLKDTLKSQFPEGYPYINSGLPGAEVPIAQKNSFTFNLTAASNDFPKLVLRNLWGSRQIRWDVFESGWKERSWSYPLVAGSNGYVGSVAYWTYSGQIDVFDPDVYGDLENDTTAFPLLDQARASVDVADEIFWWFGDLTDGTKIAPGNYVLRVAVLAPFGDPTHGDNWDTYDSAFTVLPLV